MKIVTSRSMLRSLSHFNGTLLMATLPIKVKSFLEGSVIIYVATNLISSLNGHHGANFIKHLPAGIKTVYVPRGDWT